jgi:MYXO-CTERM domain-containing protein
MKRTFRVLSSLSLALLTASAAHAKDLPNYNASFDKKVAPSPALAGRATAAQRAFVASTDPRSGVPSFVWGTEQKASGAVLASALPTVENAARAHLLEHAELYGLSQAAIDTARVAQVHDTGRGGVIVVLRQEIGGVPLFEHDAKVLLRRDRSLVALSGSLHPLALQTTKSAGSFALPVASAVARALADLYAVSLGSSALAPSAAGPKGDYQRFDLASPGQGALSAVRFERPARARKVYFATADRLVPAYYVELFSREAGGDPDVYGYVVAADSGDVLVRRNLTAHAAFKYRVWADETGDKRPLDGPIADFTPHPTGVPDGSYPAYVPPPLIAIDGFNKFADPWLAANAGDSRGNNVDAYTDHDDSNSPAGGDLRATVTAAGEFDRVYDTAKDPLDSPDHEMAAVTQLFYVTNWLHDYWYDSGFDEAAGNAQKDNYGRGGLGSDPIRAEAQDAVDTGASNNANMDTPADGESPRMQMYLWDGKKTRSLTVLGQNDETGTAEFGPTSFNLPGSIALVDDGVSPKANGCEAIVNDVNGKIALIDRGMCTFHEKALNAEAAGATAMILVNNAGGPPPDMPASNFPAVSIPVLSVTSADGMAIKTALLNGEVTATLQRETGVRVDGTIDNLVVAHEWGHYLHHRLVSCGLNQCGGESEGWGDFNALMTQVREGDNLDGAFSDAVYATIGFGDAAYFGTRRVPYSVDMKINPLTFKHIQQSATLPDTAPLVNPFPDNAEVHNTGELWANMLFEGLVSLLKQSQGPNPKYTFEQGRRRMADYVVAGMILAPQEPTFTEQRDGLIAAAYAADPEDALLLAQAFAKRGAGSCAESPPRESFDNEGVVESFVVAPAVSITGVKLDDSTQSCDKDGLLDAGEVGKVTISLANRGFLPAPGTKVTVSSATPGVTFPKGAEGTLATLDGFATSDVTFDVQIDPTQKVPGVIELSVTAENKDACNPMVVTKQVPRVNYDNAKEAAATDDFESDIDVWTREGDDSDAVWAKSLDDTGNNVWHGLDFSSRSDTALVTPALTVAAGESFGLSFKHRYTFEASPENPQDPQSPFVYWDGSVIEITTDGGTSWEDVSVYGNPGYGGQIGNLANNPLSDRQGYVDQNAAWPAMDSVSIDLGTGLAGKTVQLRFRIGSDEAASELGWEIDQVAFKGIVGTPFPVVTKDAASCSPFVDQAPIADAGLDLEVESGDAVTLDASKSSDPDGDELAFSWSQADASDVKLTVNGAKATFVAPEVKEPTTLTFAVSVTAAGQTSTDTVKVLVTPLGSLGAGGADPLVDGGGCGCAVPGDEKLPAAPLGALGALALGVFAARRRGRRI